MLSALRMFRIALHWPRLLRRLRCLEILTIFQQSGPHRIARQTKILLFRLRMFEANRYQLLRTSCDTEIGLGQGAMSKVKLARDLHTGEQVALKLVRTN